MSTQSTHICAACKLSLPPQQFHKNRSRPSGLSPWCKSCRRVFDGKNRPGYRKYTTNYRRRHRARKLIGCIRRRAKDAGIPFDLDQHVASIQARIDAGVCELSGIRFDLDSGRNFASPSIDRINPKLGYVLSNVRVICHAMNCAMNDWGEEVLFKVVTSWLEMRAKRQ